MAILGEIRKKTWLLIIVIGVAMVAFVAGDLFSENSVLRTAFTGDPNVMGTVNGDDITYPDYNSAQQIVRNKAQNQGMNLPENMISQEAWNMALSKKLFAAHAEKTGMVVTDDDVWNYLAASAGFPSGNEFKQLIEEERKNGNPNVEAFFANFEENRSQLLAQKYIDLVSSAAVSTNIEAAFHQQSNIQTAEIEYGFANYENLKTNFKIEVTDEEISQYIKKHPKHFKREALVDLSYVYFSAQPSEADFSKAKEDLSKFLTKHVVVDEINNISDTIESFAGTANDSIYISKYSDQPFMSYFFTKEEIEKSGATQEIKSFLNSASVGQVGGPFKQENSYQLLKISKVKPVNDSVNSSHILISFEGSQASQRNPNITRTKEQAKVLADSLLAAVKKNPSAFNELATEKSDDLGSKSQNGNVGWVSKSSQNMAFTYLNYITNHTKGSIGLVESEFGYHIIRIDDTKVKTGYQIAILLKEVNASQKTTDDIFENATSFAQEISGKSLNDFVNEAIKKGYNYGTSESLERFAPRIITEDRNIGGDQDYAILKWLSTKRTK